MFLATDTFDDLVHVDRRCLTELLTLGHDTSDGSGTRSKYRPAFMDHFDRKEREDQEAKSNMSVATPATPPTVVPATPPQPAQPETPKPLPTVAAPYIPIATPGVYMPYQRSFIDGDFDFVSISRAICKR